MKNIEAVANAVLLMDKQLREELLIKDGAVQSKKLWENTHIKHQLDRRSEGTRFTVADHIRAMVYSMLSSGITWERVEDGIDILTGRIFPIDEIFFQYDVDAIMTCAPEYFRDEIKKLRCGSQYTLKQMRALLAVNIGKLIEFEKKYGSIDEYYQTYIDKDKTCKSLVKALSNPKSKDKFVQMGEALVAEYLRNMGYDLSKPDRHIRRILGSKSLGCSDKEIVPVYEAFDIVAEIAQYMGRHVAEVDYILWMYCATGYGGVCIKKHPKCDVCTAREICKSVN